MVSLSNNKNGFSLIEVAIVMVIIGILAGGGISMLRTLTERKFRNESFEYMKEVREALITYSDIYGKLPCPDTDGDGNENNDDNGTPSDLTDDTCEGDVYVGELPYMDLGVKPRDPYKNVLKYEINANLGTDRSTSCENLRSGLSGDPGIVDVDGSTTPFPVAAVIVSSGKSNADSTGDWFDDIATGAHQGDNTDGNPNYIRSFPVEGFDDFVMYIGANELYGEFCEFLILAVNNNTLATVHVWNETRGMDLGSLTAGTPGSYDIVSGTEIQICSASGGCSGSPVTSTPSTPIALSGKGKTIDIP